LREDGKINVENAGVYISKPEKTSISRGKAFIPDKSFPAKLRSSSSGLLVEITGSFTLKKTLEVLHPPDIEGRAVWAYPVLLRAAPVGLPKTISLSAWCLPSAHIKHIIKRVPAIEDAEQFTLGD
jgi:hypothetical protein